MLKLVNATPLLPQGSVPPELQALSRFDQDLIQALFRELTEHAYRLNNCVTSDQVLPTPVQPLTGLKASPNAGAPGSKIDVSYTAAIGLVNQSFTVDLNLAGPILNGRDQNTAFAANQFVYVYAITGPGKTPGGIVSLTPPTSGPGPTLPAGYTLSAFLFPARWSTGPSLLRQHVAGNTIIYDGVQNVLGGGTAATDTVVDCSSLVPPLATTMQVFVRNAGATAVGGGLMALTVRLSAVSGLPIAIPYLQIAGTPGTTSASVLGTFTLPNINQQFFYALLVAVGSAPFFVAIDLPGYTI